jgi:S-DNA-T family DNA segregation ATPase FtsK/SpoIIIE
MIFTPTRHRRLNQCIGLLMIVAALLLLLALLSYHPSDPSLNTAAIPQITITAHPAQNWIGVVGSWTSDLLLQTIGISALFLPLLGMSLGIAWFSSRSAGSAVARLIGIVLVLLFLPASVAMLPWHILWAHAVPIEGASGRLLADALIHWLNLPGACVLVLSMSVIGLWLSWMLRFHSLRMRLLIHFSIFQSLRDRLANWKEHRAEKAQARLLAKRERELENARLATEGNEYAVGDPLDVPARHRQNGFTELASDMTPPVKVWEEFADADAEEFDGELEQKPTAVPPIQRTVATASTAIPSVKPGPQLVPLDRPMPTRPEPTEQQIAVEQRADADLKKVTVTPKSVMGFKLPPSSLLHRGEQPGAVREDELREEAQVLVEKCAEFDIGGQVVQINPGPMVTTFEFKPEAGVKYSRVTGLADDLCLAMRAESILIERMAGKSTVGIQVPNHERETIWFRDVIESETFTGAKSRLTMAMGKDINGRIAVADLATMPHILIAGSTGSGKSVAINAMIMSLLYRTTPEQVRLILVDPKRVELGMYEGVPHLFTPIITEPKLAANALRNAVREMERRLKLLASRSVRNIDQYNKLFESGMTSLFADAEDEKPLPYIVIIIDELADLMMLDKANVEESITRLAQMARAVGIHLILATQRPSVDVITGLIKANVPTRISFRLATKVDSRTILDTNGAESLLGRGDMLFLPPGTSRLMRLHAPYVSEKETAAVVAFWKEQADAEYAHGFLESPKDEKGRDMDASGGNSEDSDELYDDGVRLVFEFGKASTSLLQRRLRIGYGRAAHLIDLMERDGLVGPSDGSKPRELLKSPGWIHETEEQMR